MWTSSGFQEHFRGGAPDHDEAVELVFLLEVADVFAELLGEIEFCFGFFDVRAVKIFYVGLVEGRLHRLDVLEKFLGLGEIFGVENAGFRGGFVGVVGENVPAAEDEIVELRERHEIFNFRHAIIGALSEADGTHLRERADRQRIPFAEPIRRPP